MTKRHIFRAQNVPANSDANAFRAGLLEYCTDEEKADFDIDTNDFDLIPGRPNEAATVLFSVAKPLPKFLKELVDGKKTGFYDLVLGDEDIAIHSSFMGFTQLYPTSGTIDADIIALHGLNSHPYGSFQSKEGREHMWLRDFFRKDFPNTRTATYGYDSGLTDPKSIANMRSFVHGLLSEIEDFRSTEEEKNRPIIWIAHNFGGMVISQTLVHLSVYADRRASILDATRGMLFFGVPHRGMRVNSFRDVLKKSGNTAAERSQLLEEIDPKSNYLMRNVENLVNICAMRKYFIYSFYEQMAEEIQTEVNQEEKNDSCTAAHAVIVHQSSAVLQLPDTMQEKIRVMASHSGLVIFENPTNSAYLSAHRAVANLISGIN